MKFKIMLDDTDFTKSFFQAYNKKHNTDFVILDFEYDEVTFAVIQTEKGNNDDILKLGIEFAKHSNLNRILN